ncbi:replication-associated recombination protein A [Rothia sp. LK2588]|uniref:replication-associated recombination protein A n=1 Tax=Rothia sp. LK2588 TaxID=3114369 RepID=UPI0039082894
MTTLFDAADSSDEPDEEIKRARDPLAVRMRPRTLDEVVGQKHLLRPGSPLRVLAGTDETIVGPSSIILWGPPGTGKTTLAHVIARSGNRKFVELSAVTAGVKDVRAVMEQALEDRDFRGISTVLFLDEIHRFTKAQQDALLPGVENRWIILVAATTENPSFSVISPLLSRSVMLTLQSLQNDDIEQLVRRALTSPRGLRGQFDISEPALDYIVRLANGDARKSLTSLEAAAAVAYGRSDEPDQPILIDEDHAVEALNQASVRYDRGGDQHYDVVSAFIKSIRGSDVDAALHYLARMIVAGEDPRFIARRLVVHASEDVGMADPSALTAAVNAAQAVQLIGMPEARINLAQATIHLATAPKSNAVIKAIDAAMDDVKQGSSGNVPPHLRDSHYGGAQQLGHGAGYKYPHDERFGISNQQYLPDVLQGREYYEPTVFGHESGMKHRLETIKRFLRGE